MGSQPNPDKLSLSPTHTHSHHVTLGLGRWLLPVRADMVSMVGVCLSSFPLYSPPAHPPTHLLPFYPGSGAAEKSRLPSSRSFGRFVSTISFFPSLPEAREDR